MPLVFQVEDVYPIENGIIAKVRYDRDKLVFDPNHIKKDNSSNSSLFGRPSLKEWTYMTITDHPLDDIHPLAFVDSMGSKKNMVQTHLEIVHVAYKIPLIILYNPATQQTIFGLIKNCSDSFEEMRPHEDIHEEGLKYIRSIEPDSRHPDIFNMSKEHKLVIEEVFSISSPVAPSRVFISRGLSNPYELNIGLFNLQGRKLEIY